MAPQIFNKCLRAKTAARSRRRRAACRKCWRHRCAPLARQFLRRQGGPLNVAPGPTTDLCDTSTGNLDSLMWVGTSRCQLNTALKPVSCKPGRPARATACTVDSFKNHPRSGQSFALGAVQGPRLSSIGVFLKVRCFNQSTREPLQFATPNRTQNTSALTIRWPNSAVSTSESLSPVTEKSARPMAAGAMKFGHSGRGTEKVQTAGRAGERCGNQAGSRPATPRDLLWSVRILGRSARASTRLPWPWPWMRAEGTARFATQFAARSRCRCRGRCRCRTPGLSARGCTEI